MSLGNVTNKHLASFIKLIRNEFHISLYYCPILLTCQVYTLNNARLNIQFNFGTVRPFYKNLC